MSSYHLRDNIYKPLSQLAWQDRAEQLQLRPHAATPADVAQLASDLAATERRRRALDTELDELKLVYEGMLLYEREVAWPRLARLRTVVRKAKELQAAATPEDWLATSMAVRDAARALQAEIDALFVEDDDGTRAA